MVKTRRHPRREASKRARSKDQRQPWNLGRVIYSDQVAGDGVEQASPEEVLEALSRVSPGLPWDEAAGSVLPVIPRLRPYPAGSPVAIRVMTPPGIAIGFGLDFGPGFMNVTDDLLAHWSVTVADVTAWALRNVHERAGKVRRSEIHRGDGGGVVTEWLQTNRSVGSTLVLAPTELTRLFGPDARRFITPMRDLIIGFPADVDPELVAWYYVEVASQDPNCLGPMSYLMVDGHITPEPLEHLIASFQVGTR